MRRAFNEEREVEGVRRIYATEDCQELPGPVGGSSPVCNGEHLRSHRSEDLGHKSECDRRDRVALVGLMEFHLVSDSVKMIYMRNYSGTFGGGYAENEFEREVNFRHRGLAPR